MKKLNVLTRMLLLVALLVGNVGNAWGADEIFYTLTATAKTGTGSNNSYSGNCDIEVGDYTWNVEGNSTLTPWRIGGKSITKTDRAVYSKTAMNSAVTKVELTVGAASSITVNSLKLIVASDANFSSVIDEVTKSFTANSTITFTPTSPATNWASGAYYKFVFNVTVSESSNKFVEFKEAKFYRAEAVAYEITAQSNNNSYGTVSLDGSTITASPNSGYRYADPAYTVSPANSATVSQNGNLFTVTPSANTTVTINFEAIPTYMVTFNDEAGICATTNLTEASGGAGVVLPAATIDLEGWTFAGWATAATANTSTRPTLYLPGAKYYPEGNITLHAVYTLEGIDDTKYKRVTELSEATSAGSMIFVDNTNSKVFKYNDDNITYATAPTETNGLITPSDDMVWNLSGDNTDGYNVIASGNNRPMGFDTPSESTNYANIKSYASNTLTNGLWKFVVNTSETNLFTLRNNTTKSSGYVGSLRFYAGSTNKWQVYYLAAANFAGNSNTALRLYIPVLSAYNSNPTQAVITPVVAFNSTASKTLYLDGTTTYTNAASVTGVDKPITYSSSDVSVATVSSAGEVTAVGIGNATITASVAAELGVNKAASKTYDVVVKNTTTIAGLKALYNAAQSPAKAFAADLTDAVVTYVSGTHAYIQDASGAIYASCGSSLTAGKKINGAVSGTISAPNQIDEIKTIDLSDATVTDDGVIPAALTKTVAEVKADAAALDGQLVTINAVTIDKPSTTTTLRDGSKIEEVEATITMYSPNSAASVNDKEKGNFTGYISLYNGETPRINLYDERQFVKTHNAPTAQVLTFDNEDIQLDEETPALTAFTGQDVNGAHTTLTWSIEDGSDDIFTSFDTTTGALVLKGSTGSAIVNVSAAAGDVVDAGVTTPYLASDPASYMITVNARHTVTFKVLGKDIEVREVASGAGVTAPEVETMGANTFLGWTNAEISVPQDDAPSTLITETEFDGLTGDVDYYAVFGKEKTAASSGSYTLNYSVDGAPSGYGKDKNIIASDESEWVVRAYDNSGYQINTSQDSGIKLPTCPDNITTIVVTGSRDNYFSFGTTLKGSAVATPTNNVIDLSSESYKTGYINPASGANIITKIVVNYATPATYDNYCTSPADKSNIIVENEDGDYVAEEIKLTSGEELNLEHDVIADKVTNDRTLTADEGAYTWYEPYAYTLPAGNTAYTFSGVNGSALQFAELGSQDLEANTPYLVLASNSVNGSINAETVVKATPANDTESGEYGNWTFVGTYKSMTAAEAAEANMWALGASNKWFYYTGSDAYGVYPRRAYMINSEDKGSGEAKIFGTDFGGSEVTHIELINGENPDECRVYSLDGKYIGKKNEINVKGVVIENGKKVIRK